MIIRAVGRQLAGLEEPERWEGRRPRVTMWQKTYCNRLRGKETWKCIWSDFEMCLMSRGILIKEDKNYEFYLLHAGQKIWYMKSSTPQYVPVVWGTLSNESSVKNKTKMLWKWHIRFRVYLRLIVFGVYWFFSPRCQDGLKEPDQF